MAHAHTLLLQQELCHRTKMAYHDLLACDDNSRALDTVDGPCPDGIGAPLALGRDQPTTGLRLHSWPESTALPTSGVSL